MAANELTISIERLGAMLAQHGLKIVVAESLTGGLLAASLTDVAGSSDWFEGGFVAYRLSAKEQFLGVPAETLGRWGAVSEPTAKAMVQGALDRSSSDIAIATTGVAGPGGGEPQNPTGTVWIGWGRRDTDVIHTARFRFKGNRASVRRLTTEKAVWGALELLESLPG